MDKSFRIAHGLPLISQTEKVNPNVFYANFKSQQSFVELIDRGMEPLPILPPNIWPGPIPQTGTPEYAHYQEFVLAYESDEVALKLDFQKYWEENNPDINLRALAYTCVTYGTDVMEGHQAQTRVVVQSDDGGWSGPDGFWDATKNQWGKYTLFEAVPRTELPPSEDLPLAIELFDTDQTSIVLKAQHVGEHLYHTSFLFSSVAIPQSAKINYAYIRLVAKSDGLGGTGDIVTATIGADDTTNAVAPTDYFEATDLANRLRNERQYWSVELDDWVADQTYYTNNIACVIQPIVNKSGWQSGNDMQIVFIGDGTGGFTQTVDAYTGGDGTTLAPALILYYSAVYNEQMSGGILVFPKKRDIVLGGEAIIWKLFTTSMAKGVKLGGMAPNSNSGETDETMSGGIIVAGSADSLKFRNHPVTGGCRVGQTTEVSVGYLANGVFVGGQADAWVVYDPALKPHEWHVIATGGKNIPQDSHDTEAACWLYVDESESRLYYQFSYFVGGVPTTLLPTVTLNGPCKWFETAPVIRNLNPQGGSIAVNAAQITALKSGFGYLQFTSGSLQFRSQIDRPGQLSGAAEIVNNVNTVEVQGGTITAGTAPVLSFRTIRPRGGIFLDGTATVETTLGSPVRIKGGTKANGRADVSVQYTTFIAAGGTKINGRARLLIQLNHVASGGITCNDAALRSFHVAVRGGIQIDGAVVIDRIYWPPMRGGIVVSGTTQQKFTDYFDARISVRVGGKASVGHQRFYQSYRSGYCRAMASENICTTPPPRTDLLITSDISPIIEHYLPTLESAGWCEVVEKCSLGVLPKIVQNRQGVYLPPKQPVRRRATSLTQKSTARIS